jgi:mono/diheme cytochrome c family protein
MWLLALACAPEEAIVCTDGIDMDGDGICDRAVADWSAEATVEPGEDRGNIYQLSEDDLLAAREAGLGHIFRWPVSTTRLLLPYQPMLSVFEDPDSETLRRFMDAALGFSDEDGLYDRMGLSRASGLEEEAGSPYWTPGLEAGTPLGAAVIETPLGEGLTFSCATCHTGELFGRPVVGLANKRPRPNTLFHFSSIALGQLDEDTFQSLTSATEGEVEMFTELLDALSVVGTREPVSLGLDTSLAQVALSLARRSPDATASFDDALARDPAAMVLDELVADSRPMVWWTMRHKTRWLADGSIVSGNPVLTNFLWNEIGRGADLEELAAWLASPEGGRATDELTVAVFATPAPKWVDFFGTAGIDEDLARSGQVLFESRCSGCHGSYDKGWDAPDAAQRDAAGRLETVSVRYHAQTPRVDVGTDPQRAQGMADLERLNSLDISAWMQTLVVAEATGYVPPPLDGIWARYPYLHNNAVPTLCALLSPAEARPGWFIQGPADNAEVDYDADCVGYPIGEAIPTGWLEDEEARYTVGLPGQSATGHDEMLYDDGVLVIGPTERAALIAFLKTL